MVERERCVCPGPGPSFVFVRSILEHTAGVLGRCSRQLYHPRKNFATNTYTRCYLFGRFDGIGSKIELCANKD